MIETNEFLFSPTLNDDIVGTSLKFREILRLAKRIASSPASVLITGESGTGKEVIARAIHNWSDRRNKIFLAINCAAIPETLLESELFGFAKGSFTGAINKKAGLFEEAEGGTLFLDEIGDMSFPLQAKLLRVLQDKMIKRVGENRYRSVNIRIIAATHKNLKQEVIENRFREDLYFRLNVIPLYIPPLREHKEDIVLLAQHFLKKFSAPNYTKQKQFAQETINHFMTYPWPGNIRELENTIERAIVLTQGDEIKVSDLLIDETFTNQNASDTANNNTVDLSLDEIVKNHIMKVLNFNKGARDKTAQMLGIDRKTLYRKLNEYKHTPSQHILSTASIN